MSRTIIDLKSNIEYIFYNFYLSCEMQLITVLNGWVKLLDSGGRTDTSIQNFEKAFDVPPYVLLKCK